jgi:two-component system, NtrC family, sensor kinase
MKKACLLWIFCLLAFNLVLAQTNLPPVYEIKSDTALTQVLNDTAWQKLEDKEGKWTIGEVSQSPLSERFHANGSKAESIDTNKIHTYWQRYRLKNSMGYDAKISLTAQVDYFDVFLIRNGAAPVPYHTGLLQQWDKKDGLRSAFFSGAVSFVIKPGEEVLIYNRRQRQSVTNYKTVASFYNTDKLVQQQYIDKVDSRQNYFGKMHMQEAFVLGLLTLTFFINLLFYRIVKEKVYLYFALFALFLGFNRLTNIASLYFLWQNPAARELVGLLGYAWGFIPFFLIQFFRYFLKTKASLPRWDKWLYGLGIANMIIITVSFFSRLFAKSTADFLANIFSILPFCLIPLCIVITLLLFINKKDKPTRYLIIGAMPLMLLYLATSPVEAFGIRIELIEKTLMQNFRLVEVACITWLVISFSLILLLRFDHLQKENTQLIQKQKTELEVQVAERTADLKRSIEDLKSTQSQLIQAEKMASLGELTAGIAHEIQNPLNFVNNFSEVSNELIEELQEERNKEQGTRNEELQTELLNDIKQNLEKINHHGKRADAIVKGMLQHSRSSSGVKEPTDINALADEYLKLAYHGLRAKDKLFNAALKTDYDETIGNINIIPQDTGRVILNLITNAFYAVNEKTLSAVVTPTTVKYEPSVSVSTKKVNGKVEISVKDNGNGIPQKVLDKIFQPFFTTKPTGQGTGLGLSLSYDIIKAHGGELKVNTKEGEFAEFVITLPL